jgi:hypothetical protein
MASSHQAAATAMLEAAAAGPPTWTGVMTIVGDQGSYFHGNVKGYCDSASAPSFTNVGSLTTNGSNQTPTALMLDCSINAPNIGKTRGFWLVCLSTAEMFQDAWTTLEIKDQTSAVILTCSSSDGSISFFSNDNGDGTWSSQWQSITLVSPTVNQAVPNNFTYTLT